MKSLSYYISILFHTGSNNTTNPPESTPVIGEPIIPTDQSKAIDESPFSKDDSKGETISVPSPVIEAPEPLIVDGFPPVIIDPEFPEKPESSSNPQASSLLDNKPYMSLAEQVCNVIILLKEKSSDGEATDKLKRFISRKLINALLETGATPITGETSFNTLRHECITDDILKDGTPIQIVEDGIAIEERVMILAKVKPLNQ